LQNKDEGVGFIIVGLIAIGAMAFVGGYGLEAMAECVRSNAVAINSNETNFIFDNHSTVYRITVSSAWAVGLYAALRLFSFFFHKIDAPALEAIAVVAGVVLAAFVPPHFVTGLCSLG
jgi:hypothetical protein